MTMSRFLIIIVSLLVTSSVESFTPVPNMPNLVRSLRDMQNSFMLGVSSFTMDSPSSTPDSTAISPKKEPSFLDDIKDKFTCAMKEQPNPLEVLNGGVDQRGEMVVNTQVFSVLLMNILTGGLPIVGDLLSVLSGPVLMALGSATCTQAFLEKAGDDKNMSGIYSQVRHPVLAGILAIMAGYSVVTASAPRLLMTVALSFALDQFTNDKEEELDADYLEKVPTKFLPKDMCALLPWVDYGGESRTGAEFQ